MRSLSLIHISLLGRSGWTNHADEALLPLFDGVSGVWFSGGDQLHTTRLLLQPDGSDTPVLGRMRRLLSDGGVIGGSSAGAAIMSRTMIVRGDDEGTLTLPDVYKRQITLPSRRSRSAAPPPTIPLLQRSTLKRLSAR